MAVGISIEKILSDLKKFDDAGQITMCVLFIVLSKCASAINNQWGQTLLTVSTMIYQSCLSFVGQPVVPTMEDAGRGLWALFPAVTRVMKEVVVSATHGTLLKKKAVLRPFVF
ncbi:hypothetical protein HPP92_004216 [Vanilla planifolia]|uniref:Uncharacterized protein n=1 Tax=Vanilla planifolia TaxID=51239 RepID=A0A835VJP1_VANPL|nr:hypothetical protein HPP92_004216 [Vanilla planifolia]